MNRSYSWLEVRSIDDDKRIIEGIATTPALARDGDIIETSGIKFKLPIPFLYRHKEPFGNVVDAKVSSDGIRVRIQAAPAGVSAAIDEQWRLVKAGAVRGLSIGWLTLKQVYDKAFDGYRILESEWVELSAVPVPSDANAMITSVRSADEAILAALGRGNGASARRTPPQLPGVSGSSTNQGVTMKSFATQITELETTQVDLRTRMATMMEGSESGELSEEESPAYDVLMSQAEDVKKKLSRLRAVEAISGTAKPVPAHPGDEDRRPVRSIVEVKSEERDKLPPGTSMARAAICMIQGRLRGESPIALAKQYYKDTPEVALYLRAAVDAGDTTTSGWASQLVPAAQNMANEFLELLRPATILGRIPGLRQVPFNIAVPLQTGGGSYGWVGEGANKPVTSLTFDSATLRWAKAAGIVVITQELARFSSPSAEAIIRNDMVKGCAQFLDGQFITPTVAEVANISPGAITNGITSTAVTGVTADHFRVDMNTLLGKFVLNNQDPSTAVILMSATQALALSMMINSLGQSEFDNITVKGGMISGLPVIVSEAVGARIILLNANDILFADDGGVRIDVSDQASVEMSTTPLAGEQSPPSATTSQVSLWQRNLVGLRVERFITWKRARTSAVEYLTANAYVPTAA